MAFIPCIKATVENLPGDGEIKLVGEYTWIPISEAEFKETRKNGNTVEQELEAVITDTGKEEIDEITQLFSDYGILILFYTNREMKIVGTQEFPVLVETSVSGRPQAITLSFKRESPEPAKIGTSF